MAYTGAIIALDLAGLTGTCEGCAGEKPVMGTKLFHKEGFDELDTVGAAIGFIADRLSAERFIGNTFYGRGEALEDGMVRVAIEAPIQSMFGNTNAQAQLILKGLWLAVGGFARKRRAMTTSIGVTTVRKHFLGTGVYPKHYPKYWAKYEAKRVCEALGWEPPNLDAADAGAVWHWACHQWNPEMTPPVKQFWVKPTKQQDAA